MKTVMKMNKYNELVLPNKYQSEDVRFSDTLVASFISEFTKVGDTVFDPFAGFGTTLFVADKLNRKGIGIEYLPDRAQYIKTIVRNANSIICDSALNQTVYDVLPDIDFSITSPPYMSKNNHPQYPFAGYEINGKNYDDYLDDIKKIYTLIKSKMKPNAYAVIEVSNIVNQEVVTTLAWDIGKTVSEVLTLKKEIIVDWTDGELEQEYGYNHSYCLVFQNCNTK